MGDGTELSSSSKRLSTLGRTSSIARAATLRLGFSITGGTVLPAVETPFSWIWWRMLLEGSGGAASSITGKNAELISFMDPLCISSLFSKHQSAVEKRDSATKTAVPNLDSDIRVNAEEHLCYKR